jgi:UDP-N-acetylmuramoyl-L-alanyl-D-glutamate--2,6-diaminopimelate ligase
MTLHDLLRGIEVVNPDNLPSLDVGGLHYDSRRIRKGDVFVAIHGEKTDGNRFVDAALERGAVAVVSQNPRPPAVSTVWIHVGHARRALAQAAANFYGHPAGHLQLAGITGTNGKTTTAFLVHAMLTAAGKNAGLFGTIEYRVGGKAQPASNTTPESLDLQAMLAEVRDQGGTHAVLEVSSHALALERVYGAPFRVAAFTNLTRDHLDFHGDMESYFAAKKRLFQGCGTPPPECAVLNADDPRSAELAVCGSPRVITYGIDHAADVMPGTVRDQSPLAGRPNLYNRLAATATALGLGLPRSAIEQGLAGLAAVPGRFERVDLGQPFAVFVDYAHTDDALRNVLATARGLQPRRLITVFGCGGDRDRAKRPLMGEAAASLSDLAILTSDNPRSEDPLAIIEDALVGVRKAGKAHRVEPDRAAAIAMALHEAEKGDVVVIAGKGHETYQVLGSETIHFDDREVAREVLRKMGY